MTGLSDKIDTRKAPQEGGAFLCYRFCGKHMICWRSGGRPQIAATDTNIKSGTAYTAPPVYEYLVAESDAQSLCGLDELVVGRDKFCFACDF